CDITNMTQVSSHIINVGPDIVINCAAFTDVEAAETSPNMAELLNGYAVETLAKICKRENVTLVHFSTEMVFGQEDSKGYDELTAPIKPLNIYGRSKLLGEKLLARSYDKHYLVRTSWMFGPGPGNKKNFIEKVLRLAKDDSVID